jgi:hypothetical protein
MKFLAFAFIVFLTACSDTAIVRKYDKNLKDIKCLRLVVFPPDELISSTLNELYRFDDNCKYELQVSRKGGIVCNSNQNAAKKTLSNFPSSFVRLDLYQDKKPLYSYYKDLTSVATKEDIKRGFLRLKDDISIKKQ